MLIFFRVNEEEKVGDFWQELLDFSEKLLNYFSKVADCFNTINTCPLFVASWSVKSPTVDTK